MTPRFSPLTLVGWAGQHNGHSVCIKPAAGTSLHYNGSFWEIRPAVSPGNLGQLQNKSPATARVADRGVAKPKVKSNNSPPPGEVPTSGGRADLDAHLIQSSCALRQPSHQQTTITISLGA